MSLTVAEFVARWKAVALTERAAAQSHFIDLCDVLGEPHPTAVDQTGESYTFEKGVAKNIGGKGFADVWKRGHFAWEYKGKHKDLVAAYKQLLQYREDLENPPLLVVCDLDRFEVHINFTGAAKHVYAFSLDDLLAGDPTPECKVPPLQVLRALFANPATLRPEQTAAQVTERAASEFAKLADSLRKRGVAPEHAAHFLMRLLFCLFAEDINLLPTGLFSKLVDNNRSRPGDFGKKLKQLFAAMANRGGSFGADNIVYFDGGLFADDEVWELTAADLGILSAAAKLNWASIEPAIFGTLFERSLDPDKRSQLGAHYTSKDDILLIVEPVLMTPLRRRWAQVQKEALEIVAKAEKATGVTHEKQRAALKDKLLGFMHEISHVRVLDPACGSGNFLYVALRRLLDLWKEANNFATGCGISGFLPYQVRPSQLFGIELNVYAHELASVVVWIGYIQWLYDNGYGMPPEPILERLTNIERKDAILGYDPQGKPVEPDWPEADIVLGNPPFLGGKKLRTELGDKYVNELFALYDNRVPREADLVAYWFERTREMIVLSKAKRAGLLATQGIRGGKNRRVLEEIKKSGDIFWAQSDRDWILDGATVHVSMIGFDAGIEKLRQLDDQKVSTINADLTASVDLTLAKKLTENSGLCFMGITRIGPFELMPDRAKEMLNAPVNPNGRPNSDVVRPWVNAKDVMGSSRNMSLIDFGVDMSQEEAALYEMPFEYVKARVKPSRELNARETYRKHWWILGEPRPAMRKALKPLRRFLVTPLVSKHRIFVWLDAGIVPENLLNVIAREDDYFMGVLHSRIHEVWARKTGTQLREAKSGFRYTPTSTFETFPFPWPPGKEPTDEARLAAIGNAARELVAKREMWLNPPDASAAELKKRTHTSLYNERPSWLVEAHRILDEAVFAAYGWPDTLTDLEILERLLLLNKQRTEHWSE